MRATVLVPVGGSRLADDVLDAVLRVLGDRPARLVLLHVVPSGGGPRSADAEARRQAWSHLGQLLERLDEVGVDSAAQVLEGDAVTRTLEVARELDVDLIAVGSHARRGVWRLLGRGVAEGVVRGAAAPVLLVSPDAREEGVRESGRPLRRLLVPHDGSATADAVVPLVEELARTHAAEVILCRVEPQGAIPASPAVREVHRDLHAEAEDAAATLEAVRARLEAAGVAASVATAFGEPAQQLARAAREADLVVMSSHARRGVERLAHGSVAEGVVERSPRPVLVVPVRAGAPAVGP